VATPETEARLLAVGRAGTAAHVEKIVRGWRTVDRQVEHKETKARHQGRSLQVYTDEDGMVVVRGRLEPEAGAVLVRALEGARETLYAGCRTVGAAAAGPDSDPPTYGQQRADALALVAETALEHGLGADPRSERYQVVVHVDAAALADPAQPGQSVLEDGGRVSAEPTMWRSPLPIAMKLAMIQRERAQRSLAVLVSAEPDAEPDPGRFEVLRIVDTATCAVTTHREILPR
jgi:hypothetical protein